MVATVLLKDARLTFVQNDKLTLRNSVVGKCLCQVLNRLIDRFGGELERAKMHSDALLRAKIAMRTDGLGRIHVDRLHEPSGFVCTDPEHCNIGRAEPSFDIGEMRRVSRVAAEINAPALTFDHVSTPKALLPIEQATRREMLRGNKRDLQHIVELNVIPPIELMDLLESKRHDKPRIAVGREHRWRETLPQLFQRRDVQMVIVIVAEQNDVDCRQVLERYAGPADALGSD